MAISREIDHFYDRYGNRVEFKDKEIRNMIDELISTASSAVALAEDALEQSHAALQAMETARAQMEEMVSDAVEQAETATEAAETAAQTAETAAESAQAALEALEIDETLSIQGQAADAKATGDALATKQNALYFDRTPTTGSLNPVTSDGVKAALDAKQDTLTFDTEPTQNSTNPVTSDGVATKLATKIPKAYESGALANYLKNNGNTTVAGQYAMDAAYGKTLADMISLLNSSITNISNKLLDNFRVLNITQAQGSGFSQVLQDVIANCGTLTDTTVFIGNHTYNGQRVYIAYVYTDKRYAACIYYEYSGVIRYQYLNNGTYTSKTITTS